MARKQHGGNEGRTQSRRWFRFCPGMAVALLALVLLWPSLQSGVRGNRRLDRSAATPIPAPPAAPELSWIVEQSQALGLSEKQTAKVRRLQIRWEEETRPLREALAQESAALDREMAAHSGDGLKVQEFQERAAPLAELSRRLAAGRRTAWLEAAAQLTPAQREQAEAAWTRHWSDRSNRGRP